MPYIIVATDFSDAANNALHYACKLAEDCNATLTVLHSYMVPINFGENPMPLMPVDESKALAEERMNTLIVDAQKTYPNLIIDSNVAFGDLVDNLQEITEKERPLMIVIGNDGANDELMWMGSNVVAAMRHVKIPVLAVPTGHQYHIVKKVCYACDFKNNDDISLAEDFIQLINNTNTELHILYIDKKTNESTEEKQLNMEDSPLHKSLKSIQPVYHFVEKDSIDKGIEEFIADNNIDWLVVVPHKHSFLDNLFKKSHTKSLAKKIAIPLVALHEHR